MCICRRQLLQLRWFSMRWYLMGKLHCAYSIVETLHALPIYESAASAAATAAADVATDPPSGKLPGRGTWRHARDAIAAGGAPSTGSGTFTAWSKGAASVANGSEEGTLQPVWLDLSGPRFLAPAGILPAALPSSFVAADSAAVEHVLLELLWVQRITLVEAYRCALLNPRSTCSYCDAEQCSR